MWANMKRDPSSFLRNGLAFFRRKAPAHFSSLALLFVACAAPQMNAEDAPKVEGGPVTEHSGGLHGYIGFDAERPPAKSAFSAGMGFYSAVWPLIDRPLADLETGLLDRQFREAGPGETYTSRVSVVWTNPGPKLGPCTARLVDGSVVTYSWYRFVDQPSFQQYNWSEKKKAALQAFVEKLHANWAIDRDYMAPPTRGKLVTLDPALLLTTPKGLEVGYVPIVTRQSAK
jgi:hypothetical protein